MFEYEADDHAQTYNLGACLSVMKSWMSRHFVFLNSDGTKLPVIDPGSVTMIESDTEV